MNKRLNRICPPLLPPLICLIAGILAGGHLPLSPAWFALAGMIFFLPFLVFRFLGYSYIFALFCFMAAAWGGVSMARIDSPFLPDGHIAKFADGTGKGISGTIVSLTCHYPDKIRVVTDCHRIVENGKTHTVSGRIRLNIYGTGKEGLVPRPAYGDRIAFYASLHPIRNFANPGGYDYEARMRYLGVFGSAHVKAGQIRIQPRDDPSLSLVFFRGVDFLRTRFWRRAVDIGGPSRVDAALVLTALVSGKKEVVPRPVRDCFSRAGVSHLMAISGFHLSLVAFGFYAFFKFCLNRIDLLNSTGRARKLAGLMTLLPLTGYALFTGFAPSTQRALIMVAAFMAALCCEKEKDSLNLLCLAGLILLVMDPPALFSISFQLSFVAVLFIILGLSLVYRSGWMPENPLAAWGAGMVWVTFFAGLGTGPLIARYFNLVSLVQVFSNLAAVPVMGFFCLPLGLAGFLIDGICPSAASWILDLGLDVLVFCMGGIEWTTGFGFSWIRVVTPGISELIIVYSFMGGLYLAVATKKKTAFICLCVLTAVGFISSAVKFKHRFFPGRLLVTVLDVGQGNAALVRTPNGQNILIDGGGFSGKSGFDTGRFIVGPFLWRQWVKTLDAVVLSHPQSDHMNGLVFIMENFKVKTWIRNRDTNKAFAFKTLVESVRVKKIPLIFPSVRVRDLLFGPVTLRLMPGNNGGASNDLNNNSLVCRLSYGDFSMLFPGDIEAERESFLVRDLPPTMILLSPHHGSRTSSSKIFLDKIRPQGVIISCGYNNRYGFPHPGILQRYRELGMKVFRTDLQGAVIITSSGKGYGINTQRNE